MQSATYTPDARVTATRFSKIPSWWKTVSGLVRPAWSWADWEGQGHQRVEGEYRTRQATKSSHPQHLCLVTAPGTAQEKNHERDDTTKVTKHTKVRKHTKETKTTKEKFPFRVFRLFRGSRDPWLTSSIARNSVESVDFYYRLAGR